MLCIDVKFNAYIFFDKSACFFPLWGGGCVSRAHTRITPAHACSSLARHWTARAKHDLRVKVRVKMATAIKSDTNQSSKLCTYSTGDWKNCLLESSRGEHGVTSWSDGSLSFPKNPQKHGGTFCSRIFRRSAPLWIGPLATMAWASFDVDRRCSVTWHLLLRRGGTLALHWAPTRVKERASAGVKSLEQLAIASVHVSWGRSDIVKRECFWRRFGWTLSFSWPVSDLDRHGSAADSSAWWQNWPKLIEKMVHHFASCKIQTCWERYDAWASLVVDPPLASSSSMSVDCSCNASQLVTAQSRGRSLR